jgi:hypothetical protein
MVARLPVWRLQRQQCRSLLYGLGRLGVRALPVVDALSVMTRGSAPEGGTWGIEFSNDLQTEVYYAYDADDRLVSWWCRFTPKPAEQMSLVSA